MNVKVFEFNYFLSPFFRDKKAMPSRLPRPQQHPPPNQVMVYFLHLLIFNHYSIFDKIVLKRSERRTISLCYFILQTLNTMMVTSKSTEKRKKKPPTQVHTETSVSYPVCVRSKANSRNSGSSQRYSLGHQDNIPQLRIFFIIIS